MPPKNDRSSRESFKLAYKQLVAITRPYWTSQAKGAALGLLGVLLLLLLAVNGLNVVINFVSGKFMTALSSKNAPEFYKMVCIYFSVFVVGTPIVVFYSWIEDKLGLHWRQWLTEYFIGRYLANRNYYRINNEESIDNPDERLAQDVRDFTRGALSIMLTVLSSIVTLVSFIAILWSISHKLVGIVLVYSAAGTCATVLMGRRLIGLKFNQLKKEANFRYNLIHVRNNVESIAFYQGEERESKQIKSRFAEVVKNFNLVIGWQRNVGFLTTGYNYLVALIPSLIIAPLYFTGKVEFGAQTQADMAFAQVLTALSLIVSSFDDITALIAQAQRLGAFAQALEEDDKTVGVIEQTEAEEVRASQLTVRTPNGMHTLVKDLDVAVKPGHHLMIMGPSGAGKSSLLRAIGGLWKNGAGQIARPGLEEMLFLPQRPYMPLGTLKEQLLYPQKQSNVSDEELLALLRQVNLPNLADRVGGLDARLSWSDVLSLGEQQRLAFARLLVSKPRYAILDEATSALDQENEANLYKMLQNMGTTYISVGHRPSLSQYHDALLELKGDSNWQLKPTPREMASAA